MPLKDFFFKFVVSECVRQKGGLPLTLGGSSGWSGGMDKSLIVCLFVCLFSSSSFYFQNNHH